MRIFFKKLKTAIVSGIISASAVLIPFTGMSQTVYAADNNNYAKLLQHSLYFYDANMCGTDAGSTSQLSWRNKCHTSDEVNGGFHDAGDHVMFGLPQGFTASTLGWSYYEFSDAYNSLGQTSHFKTISDYFSKFFKASTKLDGSGNVTRFLYQKGEGNEDHKYWGPPENQYGNRKMYWTSSGASDIAAEYAAALALSYLNFGNTEDLKYAKALYAFSTKYNQVATDGTTGFYNSSGYKDEQAWAAGWLYLATKDNYYKNECASKQQYIGWVHGWDNVALGAACVNAHITGDWSKVNSYLSGQCNSNNYFFLDKWGSARLNASMQFVALVASKNSSANYYSWCKNQMNYLLGNNPANTCFVVGFAGNSASKPHHRACSGTNTPEDNSPSKYTLVGALVGGPTDANGSYQDSRADYVCNEVAIDYNAGLVGAAAGLYSYYKTGSLDNSIAGVGSVNNQPAVTTAVTTTTTTTTTRITTTTSTTARPVVTTTTKKVTTVPVTTNTNSGNNGSVGQQVNVNKQLGVNGNNEYEIALNKIVPSGAKAQKIIVNVSAGNNIDGISCGGNVAVNNNEMQYIQPVVKNTNSSKITVEFDVSNYSDKIDYNNGKFKFSLWWSSQVPLNLDTISCVYSGRTTVTTQPTTVTTTRPTTTTTRVTTTTTTRATIKTTTTTSTPTTQPIVTTKLPSGDNSKESALNNKVNNNSNSFRLKLSDYVPNGAKPTKIVLDVSSNNEIGQMTYAANLPIADYSDKSIDGNGQFGRNGQITIDLSQIKNEINCNREMQFNVWWWSSGSELSFTNVRVFYENNGNSNNNNYVKGDLNNNGQTDIADLVSLKLHLTGQNRLNNTALANADVNNDGMVNVFDFIILKRNVLN